MKIINSIINKISTFITKTFPLSAIICLSMLPLEFFLFSSETFNVFMFCTIFAIIASLINQFFWKLGNNPFFMNVFAKDPLWDRMKAKGKTEEYCDMCLNRASYSLFFAILAFVANLIYIAFCSI